MRLLLPRRGRRGSLGGLALAALALAGCGGGQKAKAPEPKPTPSPDPALAIGITDENPAFLAGSEQPEFDRWAKALGRMQPTWFRWVVDWADHVQPDGTLRVDAPQGGCQREIPPCAGYAGIRGQVEGIAAAQRKYPGRFRVVATVTNTPAMYAAGPSGCERSDVEPRSRAPKDLEVYRELLRAVEAEADRVGVKIEYWLPWNEPNHQYFLSPQRRRCDPDAPSVAVKRYVELARAAQDVVGDRVVPAELAGVSEESNFSTGEVEFIRGLPRDLVCGAPVFTQHDYAGGPDPLVVLKRELDRLDCERPPKIWITETGGRRDRYSDQQVCRMDDANLRRWYRDPRVSAVFHYPLRDSEVFPTGLVSTDLTKARPALKVWEAWGARQGTAPPPQPVCVA